jgi:dTDP-4-amino-4,6-dideoxygalactose transaminase
VRVPYNKPFVTRAKRELSYIQQAVENLHLSGDGEFTKRCHAWLEKTLGVPKALLTHSCTAALEMSALLAELQPGDEVILPSFTFVSTANAFVLRGAVPVFVDIRPDTLNLDERLLEAAITPRTRAICAVHYAGVGCEMDEILAVAKQHRLLVIEDAAQGLQAHYRGRPLGSMGALGAVSFHETKNIISGEGGALFVNDAELALRAEIIREKGTNRSAFFRGAVDKYTWVDVGSSYLPSEITAAFLWAQFEDAGTILEQRMQTWARYRDGFAKSALGERLTLPTVPAHCTHNAHMFYVLTRSLDDRNRVIRELSERGINAVFHYVPLHSSPAGRRFGRAVGSMAVTDSVSDRLVRLPLWVGLPPEGADEIVDLVQAAVSRT